jgi:hypothetical protein
MKMTYEMMFSNGTEFMIWTSRNCDLCVKQSHYNSKTDEYTKFKCRIDADMTMQQAGLSEISVRSYETVQQDICPYMQTGRRVFKKRKIKNQTELELDI